MLGTIGENERMESTVIADSVNLAARIEGLTKHYGVRVIISESTYAQLRETSGASFRFIGEAVVKGRSIKTALFEMMCDGAYEASHLQSFAEALLCYKDRKFNEARALFEQLVQHYPGDNLLDYYIGRSLQFERNAGEGWSPVEVFEY
jgi:two-component system sensor histidine kinase ChiS